MLVEMLIVFLAHTANALQVRYVHDPPMVPKGEHASHAEATADHAAFALFVMLLFAPHSARSMARICTIRLACR